MEATTKEDAVQAERCLPVSVFAKDQERKRLNASSNHPKMKHTPPMGVIAPSHRILVNTNK
jgi:hypothetical protein